MARERTTVFYRFAAGSDTRSMAAPAGTIGFYAKAANASGLDIDGGDDFPLGAAELSPYFPLKSGQVVKLDADGGDTGACAFAFVIGDVA